MKYEKKRNTRPEATNIQPSTMDGDRLPGSLRNRRVPTKILNNPLPTPVRMKKKFLAIHGIFMLLAIIINPKKHM